MANKCDLELKNLVNENKQVVTAFKLDADDAVASLIGRPKSGDKVHDAFYTDMYGYFMKSGDIAHYNLDPWVMGEQWRNYFNSVFVDEINPNTINLSSYRIKSMHKRFLQIRDRREKAFTSRNRKDGMSNSARALLPPSILAMRTDRYGFISKLVQSTKDLADKIKQSYASFDSDVSKIAKRFHNNAQALYGEVDKSSVLDGLSMQDSSGSMITIYDRKLNAGGNPTLQISYKDNEYKENENGVIVPNKKWVAMSTLGISETMYRDAYISKYTDDFINDILHGQTRLVEWYSKSDAKGDDRLILEAEMELLKHRNDADKDEERGRSVSNISRKYKQSNVTISDPKNPNRTLWSGTKHYIMIKSDQGAGKETYRTYLMGVKSEISDTFINESDGKAQETEGGINEYQLVKDSLKNGYYNSQESHTFTNHQNRISVEEIKRNKLNFNDEINSEAYRNHIDEMDSEDKLYPKDSMHNAFVDFQYMEKQPDQNMTEKTVLGDSTSKPYSNMWDLVSQYRNTYEDVGKDIKKFGNRTKNKRARVENSIRGELKKKGLKPDEIQIWMQENIYDVGGIESRVWEDRQGNIHTPDSKLELRQENYAPIKWTKGNFFNMLDNTIFEIRHRLEAERDTLGDIGIKALEAELKDFEDMAHATADRKASEQMIDQAVSIHKKRRRIWTNPLVRRKNAQVHVDYLDDTYRNLHKNELMIDLIEQMHNVIRTDAGLAEDSIDYMVNRVKLATGRSDVNVSIPTPLGWADWSNKKISHMMNKLPEWFKRGRVWDEDGVESTWLTLNGLLTMRFLGPGGAVGNRTQSLNNIIAWGLKSYLHTKSELSSREDYWNEIVDGTGVLNLISVFNDVMLQGGDLKMTDAGFVPLLDQFNKMAIGASIPVPTTRMFEWRKVARAGKPKWIKNGDKSIDSVLLTLMKRSLTTDERADAQYGRELDNIINEFNKTDGGYDMSNISKELETELRIRRGAYWDIQMTDKDSNTREILERRFKNLIGDISDTQLKKMVTFKLTYWVKGLGEKMFTFTEGEQQMRKETAVQALLVAEAKNLLGTKGSQRDRMTSPDAIKIARNAVYQMMFGMSPVHLGEMFSGIGRTAGQYKSYPLFQHIKDHNTMTNFVNGGDVSSRMFAELKRIATRGEYNVEDKHDHEAAAAARLVLTRGTATMLTATGQLLTFVAPIMRLIKVDGGISLTGAMRSAENPLAGTAYRAILWAVLMAYGWGDDEDRERVGQDTVNRLTFLFIPAILGAFARWGYDFYKKGDDNEGIWEYI